MPATNEVTPNRGLTGTELATIEVDELSRLVPMILEHVREKLNQDGMYRPHLSYGQVGYRITVELQLSNPTHPTHKTVIESNRHRANQPAFIGPINPNAGEGTVSVGKSRTRTINNPNKERVVRGMPVTVVSGGKERPVTYDPAILSGEGNEPVDVDEGVVDKDVTPDWSK